MSAIQQLSLFGDEASPPTRSAKPEPDGPVRPRDVWMDMQQQIKRYAEDHGVPGLAWVAVPVGDPNWPSRERLRAMGREALEFAMGQLERLPSAKTRCARISTALRDLAAPVKPESSGKEAGAAKTDGPKNKPSGRRGKGTAPKEPDLGPDVGIVVPGAPEWVRGGVDWARLHGTLAALRVDAPGRVAAKLPVRLRVTSDWVTRGLVQCGFRHGTGLRDWAVRNGCIHPVVRRHRTNPQFEILPPEVLDLVWLEPLAAEVPDGGAAKRWPADLGEAVGAEADWREAAAALAGCRVTVELWYPVDGLAFGAMESAAFVLDRIALEDGWLCIEGTGGWHLRHAVTGVEKARWFNGSPEHVIFDGLVDEGYRCITLKAATHARRRP